MGALRSKTHHSLSSDAVESDTRREISVLEDLRDAARGSLLSIEPILAHTDALARSKEFRRSIDLLSVLTMYRQSFSRDEFDVLRLAMARAQVAVGESAQAVDDLESLVDDDQAQACHRGAALVVLAEIAAADNDYRAAASLMTLTENSSNKCVYEETAVVLARTTYSNLGGDSHSALEEIDALLESSRSLSPSQTVEGFIHKAWALTNLGRFAESDNYIDEVLQLQHRGRNVLRYIKAWNSVGARGISFGEAIKSSQQIFKVDPEDTEWLQSFFQAWSAFFDDEHERAVELFKSLPQGSRIEPALNGTQGELALQGRAYALLELGDYDAAFTALQELATAVPTRPVGARFQILMAAHSYGLLAAKLNSLSAKETLSHARRAAQVSLGLKSAVVPRLMDIEAELLLAIGRPAESRASRIVALELLDDGVGAGATPADKLSHELGLCLVDAYENNNDSALLNLRSLLPRMKRHLGLHHEKTVIARYALTSLADSSDPTSTAESDFEGLHRDLVRAFGETHLLSLKARYGTARRLYHQGQVGDALGVYVSIATSLPNLPQNLSFKTSVVRRIGDCHRQLRQYAAAHQAYVSALESLDASLSPSKHRKLGILLDINECLIKRGEQRQAMTFFSTTAAKLRAANAEMTDEYFRAVHGYASCLELLGNHAGSAHNYGHLVRLLDKGVSSDELLDRRGRVYEAAAWNNEMTKNLDVAAHLYQKALDVLKKTDANGDYDRRVADLEHRIYCCQALTT